jgi:tetraacyldisaccharide 4'-kinase
MQIDKTLKRFNTYQSELPVISVGNLSVGGSGKSPVVGFIAKCLIQEGETVAILSRGYGASIKDNQQVSCEDNATDVGDEPLMLKRQIPEAQVWVGSNRVKSAKLAEQSGATCLILDDGFQHWALKRDMDIVLVDSIQGVGNGYMIPAGCLRESTKALKRADLIIGMNGENSLSGITLNLSVNKDDVASLTDHDVLAFTGIGIPEKFFNTLTENGINPAVTQVFPDHHYYTNEELDSLKKQADYQNLILVTTAKDSVKLPKGFCTVVNVDITGDTTALMDAVTFAIREKREIDS